MRGITVEIDTARMNIHLIKLIFIYEDIGILFERESMIENYVFLSLVRAGMPIGIDNKGDMKVMYGTLDIGRDVEGNLLYVWQDIDEGEAA